MHRYLIADLAQLPAVVLPAHVDVLAHDRGVELGGLRAERVKPSGIDQTCDRVGLVAALALLLALLALLRRARVVRDAAAATEQRRDELIMVDDSWPPSQTAAVAGGPPSPPWAANVAGRDSLPRGGKGSATRTIS